ncbi:hypothetical protein GCM10009654_40290 [Streptomyces hebeiensis]|uniref:Uncharacterized protein n=1 Tax=Streptomyces hebeiensis TaxID=229486 RepID=A0ABN1UXU3_9ACTN
MSLAPDPSAVELPPSIKHPALAALALLSSALSALPPQARAHNCPEGGPDAVQPTYVIKAARSPAHRRRSCLRPALSLEKAPAPKPLHRPRLSRQLAWDGQVPGRPGMIRSHT